MLERGSLLTDEYMQTAARFCLDGLHLTVAEMAAVLRLPKIQGDMQRAIEPLVTTAQRTQLQRKETT